MVERSMNLLYPPFARKLALAVEECRAAGHDIYVFETYRSAARQSELFKKADGTTNAPAGLSLHNYGIAADIALGGPGKWHWNGDFEAFIPFFEKQGLRRGPKHDLGHFEWPSTLSIHKIKEIAEKDGLLAVWQTLIGSI